VRTTAAAETGTELAVGEFQRVMMGRRLFEIDLAEARKPLADPTLQSRRCGLRPARGLSDGVFVPNFLRKRRRIWTQRAKAFRRGFLSKLRAGGLR